MTAENPMQPSQPDAFKSLNGVHTSKRRQHPVTWMPKAERMSAQQHQHHHQPLRPGGLSGAGTDQKSASSRVMEPQPRGEVQTDITGVAHAPSVAATERQPASDRPQRWRAAQGPDQAASRGAGPRVTRSRRTSNGTGGVDAEMGEGVRAPERLAGRPPGPRPRGAAFEQQQQPPQQPGGLPAGAMMPTAGATTQEGRPSSTGRGRGARAHGASAANGNRATHNSHSRLAAGAVPIATSPAALPPTPSPNLAAKALTSVTTAPPAGGSARGLPSLPSSNAVNMAAVARDAAPPRRPGNGERHSGFEAGAVQTYEDGPVDPYTTMSGFGQGFETRAPPSTTTGAGGSAARGAAAPQDAHTASAATGTASSSGVGGGGAGSGNVGPAHDDGAAPGGDACLLPRRLSAEALPFTLEQQAGPGAAAPCSNGLARGALHANSLEQQFLAGITHGVEEGHAAAASAPAVAPPPPTTPAALGSWLVEVGRMLQEAGRAAQAREDELLAAVMERDEAVTAARARAEAADAARATAEQRAAAAEQLLSEERTANQASMQSAEKEAAHLRDAVQTTHDKAMAAAVHAAELQAQLDAALARCAALTAAVVASAPQQQPMGPAVAGSLSQQQLIAAPTPRPTSALLNEHEIVATLLSLMPAGPGACVPIGPELLGRLDAALAPHSWAVHYAHNFGSVEHFLQMRPVAFCVSPDGHSVYKCQGAEEIVRDAMAQHAAATAAAAGRGGGSTATPPSSAPAVVASVPTGRWPAAHQGGMTAGAPTGSNW